MGGNASRVSFSATAGKNSTCKSHKHWSAVFEFADNINTGGRADRKGRRNQFQFGLARFLYRTKGNGDDKCFSQLRSVRVASQGEKKKKHHLSKYIKKKKKDWGMVNAKVTAMTHINQAADSSGRHETIGGNPGAQVGLSIRYCLVSERPGGLRRCLLPLPLTESS